MKVHYKDYSTEAKMPSWLKLLKYCDRRGALCGYMRKYVTTNKRKVTCFFCKKKLKRIKKEGE